MAFNGYAALVSENSGNLVNSSKVLI